MTQKRMDRFYTAAGVEPADTGHAVVLDGRTVKTPQTRAELIVPTRALAEAIAAEWDAQADKVRPQEMPLTSYAMTALDTAGPRRDELIEGLAQYAETEMMCYRAPHPEEFAARQQAIWQPLLDWAALTYDARLNVTTSILPVEQPADAVQALRNAVAAHDTFELAALSGTVKAAGSLVIGLALTAGRLTADQAFEAAEVEPTFQIEQWGLDEEQETRRAGVHADIAGAARFIELLRA
ncbi:Chaperone required for the assembly of the F1-ATPase [Limimonas halophila]|uniref:Chaperone required for the assembly of the F1-ATPase n=1 Tax=Limimonas halophila TaxID=1082479 RepID=A0A1G7UNC6_9PROT|nr:ATP12 family protein [Limimonas halophila]SDG48619.1 Chaperone required for the assembly of the F1-ATPase [Limimonas halophila]